MRRGAALAAGLLFVSGGSAAPSVAQAAPSDAPAPMVAESLSVADCVARARAMAPVVTAAELDRSAASLDSVAASRNGRPMLSLAAGGMLAPSGFYDPTVTNLGDYQAKLGVAWMLADGGGRARERQRAGLESGNARLELAFRRREVGLDAGALAIEMLQLQEAVAARGNELDWLHRLEVVVTAGVAAGARGAADSVRIAIEIDATSAALEDLRLQLHSSTRSLAELLGAANDSPFAILPGTEAAPRGPDAADTLHVLAGIEQRVEVRQAVVASAADRLALEAAARRNALTVELVADAGLAGADLTHVVPENLRLVDPSAGFGDRLRRDLGASVAVRVGRPLLDASFGPSTAARKASLAAVRTRESTERARQRRLAFNELENWASAARQLDAAQVAVLRAERNLLRVKSLYEGGGTLLFDLLDSWRTRRDAVDRLQAARSRYRTARMLVEDRR